MDDPDTIVVDMRNHYAKAKYFGAICRRAPSARCGNLLEKDHPIIMPAPAVSACASAYLPAKGFGKVYMIDGGIIEVRASNAGKRTAPSGSEAKLRLRRTHGRTDWRGGYRPLPPVR